MSNPSLLRASQLAIGTLLSIVCVDLASCWTLLNTDRFLIWDAISVSLKVVLILLSFYRSQSWPDHTKGLIGHEDDSQRPPFAHNLAIIVLHSLIILISLLKVCFLMIYWQGSMLAAASCMVGLSLWVFDLRLVQQLYFGEVNCDILSGTGNVKCKSNIKNFVLTVVQSTPAGFLTMGLMFIVSAALGACCGMVMPQREAITILSIQGAVIFSCLICYFWRQAPTPFPGTGPMSEFHLSLHIVLAICSGFCMWRFYCKLPMMVGMILGHLVAASFVYFLSKVRKYDPSEQHQKVVTTNMWWSAIVLICASSGVFIAVTANNNGNMKLFSDPVENLVKFQNAQCVKHFSQCSQNLPFEDALKELVGTVNEAIQAFNQSGQIDKYVKAVPQVETNEKLDKTADLVSRGLSDRIYHFLFKKASVKSTPVVRMAKVYEKFRQCVNALKLGKDPQQTDQNNQCTIYLTEFTNGFDDYLEDLDLCRHLQWLVVSLTAVTIICHVSSIGQNVFIIRIQDTAKDACVKYCEKCLGETYRYITEALEWTLGSVPAVFLVAFVSYRWSITSHKWTVVPAILSIVLMAVSLYTHDGASKSDATSTDDEPLALGNISPDAEASTRGTSNPGTSVTPNSKVPAMISCTPAASAPHTSTAAPRTETESSHVAGCSAQTPTQTPAPGPSSNGITWYSDPVVSSEHRRPHREYLLP